MSISGDILAFIASQPENKRFALGPAEVAQATGHSPDKVSKLMWSLEHTGRLRLRRDGRSIVGVEEVLRLEKRQGRPTDSPRSRKAAGDEPHAPAAPRSTRTPLIDAYARAKQRAGTMLSEDESLYLSVSFRENPIAEEGLALREKLAKLEASYAELSTQYKMTLYEYEGVKSRMRDRASKSAVEAGATAVYGD